MLFCTYSEYSQHIMGLFGIIQLDNIYSTMIITLIFKFNKLVKIIGSITVKLMHF